MNKKSDKTLSASGPALAAVIVMMSLTSCAAVVGEPAHLDIASIAEKTSPFQAEILDDGTVTRAEYERSVLSQRECVAEAGASPGEVTKTGNNELTFSYEIIAADEDQVAVIEEQASACLALYLDAVGKVWAFEQLLTPEEMNAQLPDVVKCLQDVGIDIRDDASAPDVYEAVVRQDDPEIAFPCVSEHPAFFSVPPQSETHDHQD